MSDVIFLITQLAHNKHNKPLKPRTLKGKALRDSNDLTTAFTFPKYLSWNPGLLLPCCIEDRPSQPTSKWTNWHLASDIWLHTNWQNFNNKENWHLHKIGSTWHMNNNKLTKLHHSFQRQFHLPTPISPDRPCFGETYFGTTFGSSNFNTFCLTLATIMVEMAAHTPRHTKRRASHVSCHSSGWWSPPLFPQTAWVEKQSCYHGFKTTQLYIMISNSGWYLHRQNSTAARKLHDSKFCLIIC